jgi:predicted nucleic acid-binding protein
MIVLDSSAGVSMVRKTEEGSAFLWLLLPEEKVIASELYYAEIASALGKYVKAGTMSEAEAHEYRRDAIELVDEFIPISENYIEAFHESLRLNHSVYDLLYLTLARRNAATLFSLDSKLIKLCEDLGVDCVHKVTNSSPEARPGRTATR